MSEIQRWMVSSPDILDVELNKEGDWVQYDEHKKSLQAAQKRIAELEGENQKLKKQLEIAVNTLKSYGDKSNWRYVANYSIGAFQAMLDFKLDHYCKDQSELGGYVARQALAEIEKVI